MSNYIKSDKIEVFPSGFRIAEYSKSKHTSEENLLKLNIPSKEFNKNNIFVQEKKLGDSIQAYVLYINGYWFKIKGNSSDIPVAPETAVDKSMYACIKLRYIEGVGNVLAPYDFESQEGKNETTILDVETVDDFEFKGLYFSTNYNDADGYVQVRDANGELSYQGVKFDTREIRNYDSTKEEKDYNSNKSISEEFNSGKIIADELTTDALTADSINELSLKGKDASENNIIEIKSDDDTSLTIAKNNIINFQNNTIVKSELTIGSDSNKGPLTVNVVAEGYTINAAESGTFNAPINVSGSNYGDFALIQNYNSESIENKWEKISSENTPDKESIVLRDADGKTALDKLNVTSINDVQIIKSTEDNKELTILHTYDEEGKTVNCGIKINGKLELTDAGDIITTSTPSSENDEISIKKGTTIAENSINNLSWTGDLSLPQNISTSDTQYLWGQKKTEDILTSDWIATTSKIEEDANNGNKILMTDSSGKIEGTISGSVESAESIAQTQATGEEEQSSLKLLFGDPKTSGNAAKVYYDPNIYYNKNSGQLMFANPIYFAQGKYITGDNYTGTSGQAKALGENDKNLYSRGSANQPVYFSEGVPVTGTTYAGGTKLIINGTSYSGQEKAIYAPVSAADNNGQILVWGNLVAGSQPSWLTASYGASTKPVYINQGIFAECEHTLEKNVPSNAIFTDEKVKWSSTTSATDLYVLLTGSTTAQSENAKVCTNVKIKPSTGALTCKNITGTTITGTSLIVKNSSDTTTFSVTSAGAVKGVSFNATSDKRLKENITEYKSEKSILDLPIYKYDFIEGSKNQIGCLAQDLQEICPEIVNEDENGYLTIQESKLVYLLISEVKELKKQIEELKK